MTKTRAKIRDKDSECMIRAHKNTMNRLKQMKIKTIDGKECETLEEKINQMLDCFEISRLREFRERGEKSRSKQATACF